jgi:hypothetical protein
MQKLFAAATAAAACAILTAAPAQAHEETGSEHTGPVTGETAVALAEARAGTAKYQNVDAAVADGFFAVSPCVSHPTAGTMGIHYLNPARVDATLVPAEPEVLVYNPEPNGRLRLVAVEYLNIAPADFPGGLHMDPPANGLPYTLHAWVWKNNPSGTFAGFNPTAHC